MPVWLRLTLLCYVSTAQYVPNTNVPACSDEIPVCPQVSFVPVSQQKPISNAFDTVFQKIDLVRNSLIDTATQIQRRNAVQLTDRLKFLRITDNVEPFLQLNLQSGTDLWEHHLTAVAAGLKQFSKFFGEQFGNCKALPSIN